MCPPGTLPCTVKVLASQSAALSFIVFVLQFETNNHADQLWPNIVCLLIGCLHKVQRAAEIYVAAVGLGIVIFLGAEIVYRGQLLQPDGKDIAVG